MPVREWCSWLPAALTRFGCGVELPGVVPLHSLQPQCIGLPGRSAAKVKHKAHSWRHSLDFQADFPRAFRRSNALAHVLAALHVDVSEAHLWLLLCASMGSFLFASSGSVSLRLVCISNSWEFVTNSDPSVQIGLDRISVITGPHFEKSLFFFFFF